MEEQSKETLGMQDTVEVKVGKDKPGSNNITPAVVRDKAISDAHAEYVAANEAARIEYVTAKEEATRVFEEATK